jgi:hypothetical protein
MLPEYLVNNVGEFKNLIGQKIENESLFRRAYFSAYFYFRYKVLGVLKRLKLI